MRRAPAAVASAAFLVVAPGTLAGLLPWWLTDGWQGHQSWLVLRVLGAVLVLAGATVLVTSFVTFVVEGFGTPVPIAPPTRLVVGGFYRYVRNPMYVAIVSAILGQALLLGSVRLAVYAAIIWAATALFVLGYEQPALRRQFGSEYELYRRNVRAWIPRLTPWRGGDSQRPT